ncbi:MAG: metallophosphoesterase family protein [Anaerolineae bacterium]|nr:metallophosphoesterase family protein [Anaerolineae bacterium]
MKILFVSDTVVAQLENAANLRRRYADVRLVVSCGDMSAAYLEFITSVLGVPLFYVRGNHDEMYDQEPPGGIDLHRKVVEFEGLTFAGIEGSIRYNQGSIQYDDWQVANMVIRFGPSLLPRCYRKGFGVDVLVTHSPPRGIHDLEDRPHHGMRALLWFMRWYRPRYMVHGHVHTYDNRIKTRTDYEHTHIVNINPYTVLDIEPVTRIEAH